MPEHVLHCFRSTKDQAHAHAGTVWLPSHFQHPAKHALQEHYPGCVSSYQTIGDPRRGCMASEHIISQATFHCAAGS